MDRKTKTQYQYHINQCVNKIFNQRFKKKTSTSEKKRMVLMEIIKLLNITHNINQLHIIDLINSVSLNDSLFLKNHMYNDDEEDNDVDDDDDVDDDVDNGNEDDDNENDNRLQFKNILSYQNGFLDLAIQEEQSDNESNADSNIDSNNDSHGTYCFDNDDNENDNENGTSESDIQSQGDMNDILQLKDNTQLALNDSGNQCLARVRTTHNRIFNKEINNTAPYWYYRDAEGYSYGYQCKKPRMSGKPCCSMHQPKYDISSIALITEKPIELIKFEKEQAEAESDTDNEEQLENNDSEQEGKDSQQESGNEGQDSQQESGNESDDNSDNDSDENPKHELTMERVEIKNKGTFLICKETEEIFTLEDRQLVGEIIAGKYIFH